MSKRFDEKIDEYWEKQGMYFHKDKLKDFLQSEIDLERKRIVEEIENMDKSPEEEKFTEDKFKNTENMNRVFMRVGYRKALKNIISLINKTHKGMSKITGTNIKPMNKTQQLLKEREKEFMNLDMMRLASIDLTKEEIESFMSRINSFNTTTISIFLNSLKEEISKLPVDLVNTKFNKDDKDEFVDAIRVSDIDALLSETISNIKS